jgi:hypothetical protein
MLGLLIILEFAPAFSSLLFFYFFEDNVALWLSKAYWAVNVPFAIIFFVMLRRVEKVVAIPIVLLFIFSPVSGALFYFLVSIQIKQNHG